jgi:hypothetical protein
MDGSYGLCHGYLLGVECLLCSVRQLKRRGGWLTSIVIVKGMGYKRELRRQWVLVDRCEKTKI